jgi:hypothetical protein
MSEETIRVEAYLTIEGRRYRYAYKPSITSGRIVKATVNKPSRLGRDQISVKVAVVIPVTCFEPLNLTDAGLVEVPSHHILSPAFFTEPPDLDDEDGAT